MNKILRDGVDVEVAVASRQKVLSVRNKAAATQAEQLASATALIDQEPQAAKPMFLGKAIARRIARTVYRAMLPLVRPVAFRARRYLVDPLRNELIEVIERVAAHTRHELQASSANALSEVQATVAAALQEIRSASAATIRSTQESAASTRLALRDIADTMQTHRAEDVHRMERVEQFSSAAARRVAIPCSAGEMLVRTDVGFILCDATDHALIASLVENGDLEPGMRLLIQQFLRPGDTFVDVGANIGLLTLAAARALHGRGEILAFEPFAPTASALEKSVWLNGFSDLVTIHQAAVSNRIGTHPLRLGRTSGHHSLFDLPETTAASPGMVDVALVTLDAVIAPEKKIDLLKIDAEGAELDILEGAHRLLMTHPDIGLMVEFGPAHIQRAQRTCSDWFDAFRQLGFESRHIHPVTGALMDWVPCVQGENDTVNLFFARPRSAAWSRVL